MKAKALAERFSAAAGTYSQAATMQGRVAERLLAMVEKLPAPNEILDVGCGTGILTRHLSARFPKARVTAVDIAPGMIEQARQTLTNNPHVEWIVDDARNFHPTRLFQLIVSSSALHWMTPLDTTLEHVLKLLANGGQLVAALMVEGTLAELATIRERVAPGKGQAVELPKAEQVFALFESGDYALAEAVQTTFSETCTSVEAMLGGLRAQGVTGAVASGAKPLSRSEIKALTEEYRRRWASPDGSVTVDYEVLFFRAEKKSL